MKEKRDSSSLFIVLTLIVCISVVANVMASGENAVGTWHATDIDAVDLGYYVHYSNTDIAVDSTGNPHIVYRGSELDLRYATFPNNCWSTEVVFDAVPAVARESAITLDANDLPHISFSYSDGGGENLMYATQDITGTWHIETVYTPGSVGMESDVAVDSNGYAHIVHWQWGSGPLWYSTNSGGMWATVEITNQASGWHKNTIAVDGNDQLHIAYDHIGQLWYATKIATTWNFTMIDTSGENPNMAIDDNDKVHISYDSGNDLNYATNISGTWAITTIVAGVNPERNHAVAVDGNNHVHISYRDAVADDLKSVSNVSGSWITDTISSLVGAGRSNSIDIDSTGIVHVSYRYDSGAWPILYGVWSDPASGEVFVVGAIGTIVHYDGNNWQTVNTDTTGTLYGVWGFSNSNVYAAGSSGKIWQYDGNSWSAMFTTATSQALLGIWGSSPSNMYAVSSAGEVWRYDGITWSDENLGITQTLRSVWGSSVNDVFVVGDSSNIWHYDGNMWSDMTYMTPYTLNDVWGSLANDVFAVGNNGRILHYDGSMWSEMSSGTSAHLSGIWGTSATNVYAVGNNGTILHYDGSSWAPVNPETYYFLHDIWGNDATNIFVAAQISQNNSGTVIAHDENTWEPVDIARLRYANNAPEPPTCLPYLVTLAPDMASAAEVGTTVPYTLTLTNEGIMTDTFDLSATADWLTTLLPISVTLGADETTSVHVSVTVPADAANGEMDMATITAVSQGDPLISDTAILTTTAVVLPVYGISLSPDDEGKGQPGDIINYTLWLTNTGNMPDTFDLNTQAVWTTTLSAGSVSLGPSTSASIEVSVTIPANERLPATDTAVIIVASRNDANVTATVRFETRAVAYIYLPLLQKP